MRKNWIALLAALVVEATAVFAHAQTPAQPPDDIVMLTNGGRVRGSVMEEDPVKGTRVKLLDGSVRLLAPGEVKEVRYGGAASTSPSTSPEQPPVPGAPTPAAPGAPAVPAEGEGEAIVVLQDGSTHHGKLVEQASGDHITMLEGTETKRFEWAQVATVTKPRPGKSLVIAPTVGVDKNGGVTVSAGGTLDDAEAKRKEWLARGGAIVGYDASAELAYFQATKGSVTVTGEGGGAAMHATYYYLKPPVPGGPTSTWLGFRMGIGAEGLEIIASGSGQVNGQQQSASIAVYLLALPATLGAQAGFGSFKSNGEWKGVMVGVDYKPSYQYVALSGVGAGAWSTAGFQVTFDFVDFHSVQEALAKQLKEAQWRLTFFATPPVNDLPLLVVGGIGIVWY